MTGDKLDLEYDNTKIHLSTLIFPMWIIYTIFDGFTELC